MTKKYQKPGEAPNKSGSYIERGPRGGKLNEARKIYIDVGEAHLPPTQKPGYVWERVGKK